MGSCAHGLGGASSLRSRRDLNSDGFPPGRIRLGSRPLPGAGAVIDVQWGAATDVGRVRRINEDSLLASPPVFLVADGMGGYAAGDVASAIVVNEFSAHDGARAVTAEWVIERFRRADSRIRSEGAGGTTVAGIAVVEEHGQPYWLVFNLGDSRVYLRAGSALSQVSVDHSVVQELLDAGEIDPSQVRKHPQRHVITRAVGAQDAPNPDFWLVPAEVGDRLLMCSDGLTTEIDPGWLKRLVFGVEQAQELADLLVAGALEAGGWDNVTAVVVDVVAVANGSGPVEPDGDDMGRTRPREPSPSAVEVGSP